MGSIVFACILVAICITNIHSLDEENESTAGAEIIITDLKPLKKIEVRNPFNATSTFLETPTVIHQGNNLYIKPNFIFGSPFTSYNHGSKSDKCCDNVSVTSKVPEMHKKTSIVIGTPEIPQVATGVIPPVISPSVTEQDIWIPPPIIPIQPPVLIPNPFQNMPVLKVPNDNIPMLFPPIIIPISPSPPQLPRFPIVQNPIRPVVIPKPPELPPMVLPKLPIEILIKRPILQNSTIIRPIIEKPDTVPPLCPTMVKCLPPRQALPSIPDIFSTIFEKFKNLLDLPSRIDLSSFLVQNKRENIKDLTPDPEFPTLCVQGIIAERVVPNIVKNDEVKVIMNPIFPSQSSFYQN